MEVSLEIRKVKNQNSSPEHFVYNFTFEEIERIYQDAQAEKEKQKREEEERIRKFRFQKAKYEYEKRFGRKFTDEEFIRTSNEEFTRKKEQEANNQFNQQWFEEEVRRRGQRGNAGPRPQPGHPPRQPECFTVLGLKYPCAKNVILQAFRKLSLVHHPDKGGNPENFKKLVQAKDECLKHC